MTAGYPDFQRVSQSIDQPFVYRAPETLAAAVIYTPFYVGIWPGLTLLLSPVTAGRRWRIQVDFAFDQAMTQFSNSLVYELGNDAVFADVIPQLGPWCRITLACSSYAGNPQAYLYVIPSVSERGSGSAVLQMELLKYTNTLAAGVIVTVPTTNVAPGRAFVSVFNDANTALWTARVESVDFGGTAWPIASVNGASNKDKDTVEFTIPRRGCQLVLQNKSAGNVGFAVDIVKAA